MNTTGVLRLSGWYFKWEPLKVLILIVLILAMTPMLFGMITVNHDWDDWTSIYRPVALTFLQGGSPYGGTGYYNAPWLLLPLLPLAVLPYQLGRFLFFVVSLAGFAYLARRLTSNPLSIVLFISSVPVFFCLHQGNIDWIPMLAFVTPAPFALILAAIKPQIGAGIALYWLFESWRLGGLRLVIRNFLPVSLLLIASFVFYGLWPLSFSSDAVASWNVSLFPYLIPIGILLVFLAVHRRQPRTAMAAGICFAPYFSMLSVSSMLTALLEQPTLMVIAWTLLWTYEGLSLILK
jgi:hypothetical protein